MCPSPVCPCARTTRSAACLCPGTSRTFGALPCARHRSYPGHREGEGFSQRVVLCGQASFGRSTSKTEWVYGFKVALTVSPEGLITAFGVGEAASDERPIGDWIIRQDRHGTYLVDKGFSSIAWERTLDRGLWCSGGGDSQGQLKEGVASIRPTLGSRKMPDHRRGHRPTQGHLRPGAPPGQDARG
jgi:hypothetical protein